jgi:hypothetical protein
VPYTGDLRLVTLTGHSREHADVLAYVAPSHVVILCRLRSRGDRRMLLREEREEIREEKVRRGKR